MKWRYLLSVFALAFFWGLQLTAQTNILLTNPLAEQVLLGNYDPTVYAAGTVIDDLDPVTAGIHAGISTDSLKAYIVRLSQFGTRNTGSDTLSATTGIGAARRWVFQKFGEFSGANENRLVVSYLQFDQDICGMGRHRNILAVLPGSNPARHGVVLVEGHIDSRCAVLLPRVKRGGFDECAAVFGRFVQFVAQTTRAVYKTGIPRKYPAGGVGADEPAHHEPGRPFGARGRSYPVPREKLHVDAPDFGQ